MIQQSKNSDLTAQMISILRGNWITQMIYVAAELKLADYLACDHVDCNELAEKCRVYSPSLYRLLRALASIGIFQEKSKGVFSTTPLGDLLRTNHPDSLYSMALMQGKERYGAWGNLLECIKTGESAFRKRYGQPVFDWYCSHPEEASVFDNAMASFTASEIEALLGVFCFSRYQHLIDIGGGNGEALKRILQCHPHLQGTVVDLPHVLGKFDVPSELQGRLTARKSDIFDTVPGDGDIYLLKNVLHDWGDEACLGILGNIRHAMLNASADLLIYEQIIPAGNLASSSALLDLNMLVVHEGGRERTLEEYEHLIHRAGLAVRCVKATCSPLSLIEVEIPKIA